MNQTLPDKVFIYQGKNLGKLEHLGLHRAFRKTKTDGSVTWILICSTCEEELVLGVFVTAKLSREKAAKHAKEANLL